MPKTKPTTSDSNDRIIELPNRDAVLASGIAAVRLITSYDDDSDFSVSVTQGRATIEMRAADRSEAESWRDSIIAEWKAALSETGRAAETITSGLTAVQVRAIVEYARYVLSGPLGDSEADRDLMDACDKIVDNFDHITAAALEGGGS